MREKTDINLRESEKLFRNLIRNLRKRAADETAKSEMMTELNQKKTEQDRDKLYTISYETQIQRQKINGAAITTERVR